MKKIFCFLMVVVLLLPGCAKKETEKITMEMVVQNFVDVYYGHEQPTKEKVRGLRHEVFWSSDFEETYQDYVEDWTENVAVLKEVFGEDYTYSVKIVSNANDTQAREDMQKFLEKKHVSDVLVGVCALRLEITFSGNGKTYVATGNVKAYILSDWYIKDSVMESVNNMKNPKFFPQ